MIECQEVEQFTGTAAASNVFEMMVFTRKVGYFTFRKAELDHFGKESVCLPRVG